MALFTLNYTGQDASRGEIDFYDVSKAMLGFQRSLAMTTHLVQNGEIITQAPALKNARILVKPPQEGSWEIVAGVIFAATGTLALAPDDTPAGRLTRRIYDYVLRSVQGGAVNFAEEFDEDLEAQLNDNKINESKLDSLIEKAEPGIVDMHRPLVWSQSARVGHVYFAGSHDRPVGLDLTPETYAYASRTNEIKLPISLAGMVSSYNSNTYKGRIFLPSEGRPIPFELAEDIRGRRAVQLIMASLTENALDRRRNSAGEIGIKAFRRESVTGRLKSIWIIEVAEHISLLAS
jgi:hypothetical protein